MSSKLTAPKLDFALDPPYEYEHLKRVGWPEDLPGPNHWKLDPDLSGLLKELKDMAGRVTDSAIRFFLEDQGQSSTNATRRYENPDTRNLRLVVGMSLKPRLNRQRKG